MTSAGSRSPSAASAARAVELEPAGERRRQPPEQEIRVGDGRARAPAAVTGRARVRPRALRPDAQRPAGVTPDDGAASGADRVDVDHRQPDGETADGALGCALGTAAGDEADVGRRTAHVERDRVLDARLPGDERRANHPCCGAGDEHERRVLRRLVGSDDAARRAHDERWRQAGSRRAGRESAKVPRADRPEVRVRGRRRRPLVLAELRRYLVRRDDVRVGQAAPQLGRDGELVAWITEREERADGNGLGIELGQRVERERLAHAVRADALTDAVAPLERDQRLRMLGAQPVEMRTRLPAKVQQVLEACRRDERRPRALALEQRVGRDRRAVREAFDLARADGGSGGEHGRLLLALGRDLRRDDAIPVEQDGVRERSADVDAENRHAATLLGTRRGSAGHARRPMRCRRRM